ncbi:hypothetical protein FHU37_003015 [Allostreptomyces psammosilenae]|uniref:Uncharacterized protein n=1 Tax=Allostreptomyces psammosilenae TaxID=1892865 RepID=A0A853A6H1_9ACTN|nr:hypothetical protein [Allostreptomyces psammosilenae]
MAYSTTNLLPVAASTFEGGTHSWSAGTNTTLSVVTGQSPSGGGTYSLRMTASASGSVSGTTPRVGVSAGTEYVAYVPVRTSAATSGRTATATITWYDAASGGTSLGTSVSAVWTLPASTGWNVAYYPVAVDRAPSGAVSATVTLTVTGLATAEYVNTDEVFMGTTPNRSGNLMDFNVSSIEQDAAEWTTTNGSLVRAGTPQATGSGYYSLTAISNAAGEMVITTIPSYPVTAGQTYVSYAAVRAYSAAMELHSEIRWFDAADSLISAETRTSTLATGSVLRTAVVGVAPEGAVSARVCLRPYATAATQYVALDDVSLCVAPNAPGNLLTYEEFSTESVLPSYSPTGVSYSRAYLASATTDGYYAVKLVADTSSIVSLYLDRLVPVSPGTTYQVGAVFFAHNPTPSNSMTASFRTRIDWFDSDQQLLLVDNPDQFYTVTRTGEWSSIAQTQTRTAPPGAAFARVGYDIDNSGATADYYFVDNLRLTESSPEYTLSVDSQNGLVNFTVFWEPPESASAALVTIRRMNSDGTSDDLRGHGLVYNLAPYSGSPIIVEDYEAPLATNVWYSVEWFKSDGTSTTLQLLTQSVTAPVLDDANYVWLKSPGNPALNTRVMMESPFRWSRASRTVTYDIVGRRNPVVVSSTRSGRSASVTLLIWDHNSNTIFDRLLDSGLPVLVQAMPGYGVDGNLYLSIDGTETESVTGNATIPGWRWTLAVTEVDRPGGGLQGSAVLTWQNITDTYATWQEVTDSHDTWADLMVNG